MTVARTHVGQPTALRSTTHDLGDTDDPSGDATTPHTRAEIAARTEVAASPDAIFRFLANLENHASLAPGSVRVLSLEWHGGIATRAVVRLRGPLGIGRTASTAIVEARMPGSISGHASIGARTRASVSWTIDGSPRVARVALCAIIETTGLLDAVLLRLGGRRWLRRRFESALESLADQLAPAAAATGTRSSDARRLGLRAQPALERSS